MERIQFSRGRAFGAALFFGFGVLFFVFAFLSPEEFATARRGRWIASDFGHEFLVPLLTLACVAMTARALYVALINPVAVEFTSTNLRLNSIWGMKEVPWSQVSRAGAQWYMKQPQLCVETREGKTIKVPLGGTDFDARRIVELLEAIAIRAGLRAARPFSQGADAGFNPDAAIERHLAQRANDAIAASNADPSIPAVEEIGQQRPTFGRKRA